MIKRDPSVALDLQTIGALPKCSKASVSASCEVVGTCGAAVVCSDFSVVLIGAQRDSPLVFGVDNGEKFLSSNANVIATHKHCERPTL